MWTLKTGWLRSVLVSYVRRTGGETSINADTRGDKRRTSKKFLNKEFNRFHSTGRGSAPPLVWLLDLTQKSSATFKTERSWQVKRWSSSHELLVHFGNDGPSGRKVPCTRAELTCRTTCVPQVWTMEWQKSPISNPQLLSRSSKQRCCMHMHTDSASFLPSMQTPGTTPTPNRCW
jgi:hypothetical protein